MAPSAEDDLPRADEGNPRGNCMCALGRRSGRLVDRLAVTWQVALVKTAVRGSLADRLGRRGGD